MTQYLTREDLEAIQRRCDAASDGPWEVPDGGPPFHQGSECVLSRDGDLEYLDNKRVLLQMNTNFPHEADAAFIAAARTDLPRALATIAELEQVIAKMLESPSQYIRYDHDEDSHTCRHCYRIARYAFEIQHMERCPLSHPLVRAIMQEGGPDAR